MYRIRHVAGVHHVDRRKSAVVDRVVRCYRSARRHRIGTAHAMVIASTEPTHLPASITADARLVWIGAGRPRIELEIVALDIHDAVSHVTPTSLRR